MRIKTMNVRQFLEFSRSASRFEVKFLCAQFLFFATAPQSSDRCGEEWGYAAENSKISEDFESGFVKRLMGKGEGDGDEEGVGCCRVC